MTTASALEPLIRHPNGDIELVWYQGSDLDFEIAWTDEDDAPVVIAEAAAMIKKAYDDEEPLFDFADYIDIVDGVAVFHVPAAVSDELDNFVTARWDLEATSDTGDTKRLVMGPARYSPSVTR